MIYPIWKPKNKKAMACDFCRTIVWTHPTNDTFCRSCFKHLRELDAVEARIMEARFENVDKRRER